MQLLDFFQNYYKVPTENGHVLSFGGEYFQSNTAVDTIISGASKERLPFFAIEKDKDSKFATESTFANVWIYNLLRIQVRDSTVQDLNDVLTYFKDICIECNVQLEMKDYVFDRVYAEGFKAIAEFRK